VKKNRFLRGSTLLPLILIDPVLWLAVLIWPTVAHSQQETRWPTHYVIVVRNTSLNVPGNSTLESTLGSEFRTGIMSLPRGLVAASGKISLWRKPEPGDLISVVFAAAGRHPISRRDCESHHYPDPPGTLLKLSTYFDVRARISVEEHDAPSNIVDPSSNLHQKLLQNLVVKGCDLIANAYSESLTLAKVLAAVGEEKYKQFFLLVFDFASPAYGSTEFNAMFQISHADLAPGTPAYFIAPIGSLKFANRDWSSDLVNYLDYPADEPGGTDFFKRNTRKFYPRLRFYRAVAHKPGSDPFYALADSQHKVASLEEESQTSKLQVAQLEQQNAQFEQHIKSIEHQLKDLEQGTGKSAFIAWSVATTFALLMVLVTWRWWVIKGRFRRMAEEYEKKLQRVREEQSRLAENQERHLLESRQALEEEFREKKAALEVEKENLEVEKEKQKRQQEITALSLLTSAICIPDDAPDTEQASESA
jgi:hypothetical protein